MGELLSSVAHELNNPLTTVLGYAEVLLAEATLAGGAPDHHDPRTHLSAVEAGQIAERAGVKTLVLTHFWHTADRSRARQEAGLVFKGNVIIGRPHVQVELTTGLAVGS